MGTSLTLQVQYGRTFTFQQKTEKILKDSAVEVVETSNGGPGMKHSYANESYGRDSAWLVSNLQDDKLGGISLNAEARDADMYEQ